MKFAVKVKLKASREGVRKVDEVTYEVATREVAEKGRANTDVMRLLAEYFGVPKSRVRIGAGLNSRTKIIVIE